MKRIRQHAPFQYGYTAITTVDEKINNTLMDFGILRLAAGMSYSDDSQLEKAYLLISGEVRLTWAGKTETISRENCFDCDPWVLHVPKNVSVTVTGVGTNSEINITRTENDAEFPAKLYPPSECASEKRGQGTMRETSTRIVRTVFDYSNAPYSKLVIGEVIDFPGKWSSYPPHHHPQPEIYFYKFLPENGYGFCELSEDVVKLRNNDTVKIVRGETHPQTTAPGYAMYYIWAIRHLDGNPYITPTFVPEHMWVLDKDAKIWPYDC